jgi:hypothetical protein
MLGLPSWNSGTRQAKFVRTWGGEGKAARIMPRSHTDPDDWATQGGRVPEPWKEMGGQIEVAEEAGMRREIDSQYRDFVKDKLGNAFADAHHPAVSPLLYDRFVWSKTLNLHSDDEGTVYYRVNDGAAPVKLDLGRYSSSPSASSSSSPSTSTTSNNLEPSSDPSFAQTLSEAASNISETLSTSLAEITDSSHIVPLRSVDFSDRERFEAFKALSELPDIRDEYAGRPSTLSEAEMEFVLNHLSSEPETVKEWEQLIQRMQSSNLSVQDWRIARKEQEWRADLGRMSIEEQVKRGFFLDKALELLGVDADSRTFSDEQWSKLFERAEEIRNGSDARSIAAQNEMSNVMVVWKRKGKTMEEYLDVHRPAVFTANDTSLAKFAVPSRHPTRTFGRDIPAPRRIPDIEHMSEARFQEYLDRLKHLTPKYREHLSATVNEARERRKRQAAGLPPSTAAPLTTTVHSSLGLLGEEDVDHFAQANKYLSSIEQKKLESPSENDLELSNRHPTGGLQYSLPSKLYVSAMDRSIHGYHLGTRQVGPAGSTARVPTSLVGGLVAGHEPPVGASAAYYNSSRSAGLTNLEEWDIGIDENGNWRDELRDENRGRHDFRITSASINVPPKVVSRPNEPLALVHEEIGSKVPSRIQTHAPLNVNVELAPNSQPISPSGAELAVRRAFHNTQDLRSAGAQAERELGRAPTPYDLSDRQRGQELLSRSVLDAARRRQLKIGDASWVARGGGKKSREGGVLSRGPGASLFAQPMMGSNPMGQRGLGEVRRNAMGGDRARERNTKSLFDNL